MSPNKRIEAVIINYKRPQNIPDIINAFRAQTVPCHITLINAAPTAEFGLSEKVLKSVDHLYTWSHPFGPYNRYVPIAAYTHEFTYFHDDDMLPGKRVLEHFLGVADTLSDFGVLGQIGRNADSTGAYVPVAVSRKEWLVPVDFVVRGYFVPTQCLPAVIEHRHNLGLDPDVDLEDDLLLCTAMNTIHGLTNYLTPLDPDPETKINRSGLKGDFARFRRAIHLGARTRFCRNAMEIGWIPLCRREAVNSDKTTARNLQDGGGHELFNDERRNGEPVQEDLGANERAWEDFNANDYWLNRGQTYISEKRLYTEPYRRQEAFIIDTLRGKVSMDNVLEIGCGFGRITRLLAQEFPSSMITAVDLSSDQLRNAREYCAEFGERIHFFPYDIYSSDSIPGNRFDTVLAIEVLMHHPYEVVYRLLERLSQIADSIVTYDRSEDRTGRVAKHVWLHDYEGIYKDLGLDCSVYVEPQTFKGQQQKLFVATRTKVEREVSGERPEVPTTEAPILQNAVQGDVLVGVGGSQEGNRQPQSRSARFSMTRIEAKIPSDHASQANLDYYLNAYPDDGSQIDVLDLGCGKGTSYDKVKKRFTNVRWTGVDIEDSAEVRARTRDDCEFVTFDGVNLPFESNRFHLILSVQVFEHVRHPEPLLREVARVLRPGGRFIGSVSQLEPFHSNSLWNFTYYGFANIALDAGFHLRELRPGVDGLTLIMRNMMNHGFRQSVSILAPFLEHSSPLNEFFKVALGEQGVDAQRINQMMLRYCGHFWFVFDAPSET
jgi:SAM-dependent methyltransferase